MATYLFSHIATVLAAIASFVMVTGRAGSRRTSQSMLAWLLAVIFVPFIAIPLFLLLGARKFPRRAKGPAEDAARAGEVDDDAVSSSSIANVLRSSGVAPPREGCSFELLPTGEIAYARFLELIANAERTIDLTMFILGHDTTGHAVVDALAARAAKGVSVRVILDAVGSSRSMRHAAATLGAVGGEVRSFMPFTHSPIRGRTNLRSHRKLAIFDGHHVFAGGMNLANEYMGPTPPTTGRPRWRDVAAVTRGSVAADARALFESDWGFCGGARRKGGETEDAAVRAAVGDELVQLVPSGPDLVTDTVYDLFLTGIFAAKERIALVTPYYVPDDQLQHAVVLAARRGVRVDVIVPTVSNHLLADVARRSLLRELAPAGVNIRYYPHGMVHAKAMVIDDAFAYVGSPNFDMRSLFLNYENALCAYSPKAIAEIRSFVDGLMAECDDVGPPGGEHRIREQLARFLAPEL
jgi:cardiolipin synthase